jgi:hypothetical protein
MISGAGNDHTFLKVATTTDGNFYISSWRSVPDTNIFFEVWLQYLNHDGYVQWETNGIQLKTAISFSACLIWENAVGREKRRVRNMMSDLVIRKFSH